MPQERVAHALLRSARIDVMLMLSSIHPHPGGDYIFLYQQHEIKSGKFTTIVAMKLLSIFPSSGRVCS